VSATQYLKNPEITLGCSFRRVAGKVKLAMNHFLPDLIQKILAGQDPVHMFGRGIVMNLQHPEASNNFLKMSAAVRTRPLNKQRES
jgi:hypothetical protein